MPEIQEICFFLVLFYVLFGISKQRETGRKSGGGKSVVQVELGANEERCGSGVLEEAVNAPSSTRSSSSAAAVSNFNSATEPSSNFQSLK